MKGQYVIIDLRNMDFMKNKEGKINWSDIEDDVVKINDADYDHEHEFYNSKFKIE